MNNQPSLKIEFHCHTRYSDGLTDIPIMLRICEKKGIDRLVITDHNTTQGAELAKTIDPQRVIVGEEILTTGGELLAAFVKEEIPPHLTPQEAIRQLREQGAFISISHPFDYLRMGWKLEELLEIAPLVDAIEVFNARCYVNSANKQAKTFAQRNGLLGTVGSDAHVGFELGSATFDVPWFEDAAGLKSGLAQAVYHTRMSGTWVHAVSRLGNMFKKTRRVRT